MREFLPRLIGNTDIKMRLGKAIEDGTLPHAFLIGGPSGSGKSVLATELSAALNCENKSSPLPLPCGKCNSCRRIYEGNFTDLKILEKQKDKATIGVDPVKLFREDMFLSATESEHKIYIIDNAECMTAEAQNALLKVLEEPPGPLTLLLLATECDKILTTIKSRTQYIAMQRFSNEETAHHALKVSEAARSLQREDKERFEALIMSAEGRLGEAERLFDKKSAEENEHKRSSVKRILDTLNPRSSYFDIKNAVFALPEKRSELSLSLELLLTALRDIIIHKKDDSAPTVFYTGREEVSRAASLLTLQRALAVYDAVLHAHELLSRNANVSNLFSELAAKIKNGLSR